MKDQHTLDIEGALLGGLLIEPERVADAKAAVRLEDFSKQVYRQVARALWTLDTTNTPIDLLTVVEWLERDIEASSSIPSHGWQTFVADLAIAQTSAANASHHCRVLRETAILRELTATLAKGSDDAKAVQVGVETALEDFIDALESDIQEISHRSLDGANVAEVSESVHAVCDDILSGGPPPGLPTSIHDIDDLLLGLRPEELILIAARPTVGKTSLALQIALNTAKSNAASVLILSLEMSRQSLIERMLSNLASIDSSLIRARRLRESDAKELRAARDELAQLRISIAEGSATTISRLRALARRCRRRHGLDLIIVDYLQLMGDPRYKDRLHEVSAISRGLKEIARELHVPVIAVSQLSRAGDIPRPRLKHLRESGTLEQDADVVITLWKEGTNSPLSCSIEKNRNGRTGELLLAFLGEYFKVAGLARGVG